MPPEVKINTHCRANREEVRNKVFELHNRFGDIPDTHLEIKVVSNEITSRDELQVKIVNNLPGGGILVRLSESL
jgi:hypothetical protein